MSLSSYAEQVRANAAKLDPLTVVITVVSAPFFVVGWILGGLWTVATWLWAAAVVGFRSAKGGD